MSASLDTSFYGHPRGLQTLFFTEMWERFSYYGMRAILLLYMTAAVTAGGMGLSAADGAAIYGAYTAGVYMAAIPGGFVADRLLGLRRAVLAGGILIALGHFCLAFGIQWVFYLGLAFIVAGTGLLKPNISAIVGKLYTPEDVRRDAAFSIFYMGINLGAFLSPLICGWLAQSDSFKRVLGSFGLSPEHSWHWGFGAAGIGMTLGVIQYVLGGNRLMETPVVHPEKNPGLLWAKFAGACAVVIGLLYGLWDYRDWLVLIGTGVFATWFVSQTEPGVERKRAYAVMILFVFAALFWAGFEQAGSSLNLFGDRFTRNEIFGLSFPSSFHQSTNSVFLIILAPVFAWVWIRTGRSGTEPSSPVKFSLGLLFVGLGFAVIAVAARISAAGGGGAAVSPLWLTMVYLLHTIGELCLSPVGLSTMTKLAPARLAGSIMGVWFMATSVGNFVGGRVAGEFERFPLPSLFGMVCLTTMVAGLICLALTPTIKKLMGGVN
ncbi:MAG: peptide MFS transporter [Vicinamibacteria bacterium]